MVSTAPRPLMLTHRVIGYVFLGIYLYLMSQMVPRMWEYQVELPARTVAHLTMGISIGVILAVKILIVRFFPKAGLPAEVPIQQVATISGLNQGRAVLLRTCVQRHDLRTVLAKPRTPDVWVETVRRMADWSRSSCTLPRSTQSSVPLPTPSD